MSFSKRCMWAIAGILLSWSAYADITTASSTAKYDDRWLGKLPSRDRPATATIDVVMLHFCSDVVRHPEAPFDPARIVEIFNTAKVSAHYLIDRDGTIFRFVPEDRTSPHAGRGSLPWFPDRVNLMNEHSIGIEMLNVGSQNDMKLFMKPEDYAAFKARNPQWIGYTAAQYDALNALLADIRKRRGIPYDRRHIVGHSEYAGAQRRSDPGELFDWSRIGLPKASEAADRASTGPLSSR